MQLKPLNSSLPAETRARSWTVPAPWRIRKETQHRRSVAGAIRKEREPRWHTVRQKGPRRPPGLQRQPLETQAEVGEMSNGDAPVREARRKKARPHAKRLVRRIVLFGLVTGRRAMAPRFWPPDRRGPDNPQQDRIACESAPVRRPRKGRADTTDDGDIEEGSVGARMVRLCRANPKDAAGLKHTGQAGQARREEDGKSRDFQRILDVLQHQ